MEFIMKWIELFIGHSVWMQLTYQVVKTYIITGKQQIVYIQSALNYKIINAYTKHQSMIYVLNALFVKN